MDNPIHIMKLKSPFHRIKQYKNDRAVKWWVWWATWFNLSTMKIYIKTSCRVVHHKYTWLLSNHLMIWFFYLEFRNWIQWEKKKDIFTGSRSPALNWLQQKHTIQRCEPHSTAEDLCFDGCAGTEGKNVRQWGMESRGSHACLHSISTENARIPPFNLSANIPLH